MSWEIFKQNMLRTLNNPDGLTDIDIIAEKWASEYDAAVKRGFDTINQVTLKRGNFDIMKQLFKFALLKGQSSTTPYDLVGELGKGVQAYWAGAQMNEFPIPLIPAPGAVQNVSVTSNLVTIPGNWIPAVSVPGISELLQPAPDTIEDIRQSYADLDFSQIDVDVNSPEVQAIINPNLAQLGEIILSNPDVSLSDDLARASLTQLDNVIAEKINIAQAEQAKAKEADSTIVSEPVTEEDEELTEEEKAALEKAEATLKDINTPKVTLLDSSGFKTLDELLRIAGALAKKLGKDDRVKYENLRVSYIAGVHGLCPQGTQAVVAALTGINSLGQITGNADWFSFKVPSTGGGRGSFAKVVNGKTYYHDKVKVGFKFTSDKSQWQIGDVIAQGYTTDSKKPYGHIQVWTGWVWMSDFKQGGVQVKNVDEDTIALWRLNENGKEAVKNRKT
jgi:hypothetical protein